MTRHVEAYEFAFLPNAEGAGDTSTPPEQVYEPVVVDWSSLTLVQETDNQIQVHPLVAPNPPQP